jgi:hypothetical protein
VTSTAGSSLSLGELTLADFQGSLDLNFDISSNNTVDLFNLTFTLDPKYYSDTDGNFALVDVDVADGTPLNSISNDQRVLLTNPGGLLTLTSSSDDILLNGNPGNSNPVTAPISEFHDGTEAVTVQFNQIVDLAFMTVDITLDDGDYNINGESLQPGSYDFVIVVSIAAI